MKLSRFGFASLVVCGIALGGCTQLQMDRIMGPSVENERNWHGETRGAIDKHDANMTAQHTAMSPDAASAIDTLRAEFTAELKVIGARADAIKSEALMHLTAAAKEMAVRFAGMPANMPIWNTIESAVSGQPGAFDDLGVKDLLAALGIGGMGLGATRLGKSRSAGAVDILGARLAALEGSRPMPKPDEPGSAATPT